MVLALVEGHLETIVLPAVLKQIGRADLAPVIRDAMGGGNFWRSVARYNDAANLGVVIGLADLEQERCASGLIARHLPRGKASRFHLRLAVRMLESWLLADRRSMARFLAVSQALVPLRPDDEPDPKRTLVELARRSRLRSIREGLVPMGTGASVGTQSVPLLSDFVRRHWRVDDARRNSPSLDRACRTWQAIAE